MAKKPPKPRAVALKSTASRKTKKRETPTPATPVTTQPTSKFTVGDRVSHSMFGDGTVTAVDGNTLTIGFADNVVKQIIDGYVNRQKA